MPHTEFQQRLNDLVKLVEETHTLQLRAAELLAQLQERREVTQTLIVPQHLADSRKAQH